MKLPGRLVSYSRNSPASVLAKSKTAFIRYVRKLTAHTVDPFGRVLSEIGRAGFREQYPRIFGYADRLLSVCRRQAPERLIPCVIFFTMPIRLDHTCISFIIRFLYMLRNNGYNNVFIRRLLCCSQLSACRPCAVFYALSDIPL